MLDLYIKVLPKCNESVYHTMVVKLFLYQGSDIWSENPKSTLI